MRIKISQPLSIYEIGQRQNQEDSLWPSPEMLTEEDNLFILCDGMGGHERGEVASQTVCKEMSDYLKERLHKGEVFSDELFKEALEAAYVALDKLDSDATRKMGCTLTLLCLHKGGCLMAHIGDSRIYHLRPQTREILYRSRDHSLVQELYQTGEITYEEMRTHPKKNVITRAVQPGEEYRVNADIVHTTNIKPGDYFYLCSDGMLEEMEDDWMMSIFSDNEPDTTKMRRLEVETYGNKDNHTAFIIHVEEVTAEAGDELFPNDEATSRCNTIVIRRELEKGEEAASAKLVGPPRLVRPTQPAQPIQPAQPMTPAQPAQPAYPIQPQPVQPKKSNTTLWMALAAALIALGALVFMMLRGDKDKADSEPANPTTNIEYSNEDAPSADEPVQGKIAAPAVSPEGNSNPASARDSRNSIQPRQSSPAIATPTPTPIPSTSRRNTGSSTPERSSAGKVNDNSDNTLSGTKPPTQTQQRNTTRGQDQVLSNLSGNQKPQKSNATPAVPANKQQNHAEGGESKPAANQK